MIYVRGSGSAIARALATLHPVMGVERGKEMPVGLTAEDEVIDKYLFCVGLIRQKRLHEQTSEEIAETFQVNTFQTIQACEALLQSNPRARICVVGSESGIKGSFDGAYAAAKAALHHYVETRRLNHPLQQLVCIAPTCILDTNMNNQRGPDGKAALDLRRIKHPKHRWLQPIEVARLIHFLLCVDEGYTTNTVIRMNGGEHCE